MLLITAAPLLSLANVNGPPQRRTGAPGDQTCAIAGCHTGTGNPTSGGIEVDFGSAGNTTYTPGAKQTWTIRITGAATPAYGFQATARLASDERNGQAGGFTPAAGKEIVCDDGVIKTATRACRAEAPVEFIHHSEPSRTNTIQVEWTAPATNVGNVRVYIAANAANNNGQNTGDRIFVANFTLTPAAATSKAPQIRGEQPVLQAFLGGQRISSGTWIEIYGSDFTSGNQRPWAGGDFQGAKAPTELEGVKVKVGGKDAAIGFVSPGQINAQVPDDIGTGDAVAVEVTTAGGTATTRVTAAKTSPALLTTPVFNVGGRQYVAALFTDFATYVGRTGLIAGVPFRPARPGETIVIYAVGCGPTNPAYPQGTVVDAAKPLASAIQVRFGSTVATAQAFLAPQAVGLCQFNVTVPNVAAGDIAIEATVDGVSNGQNLFTTVGN